MSELTQILTARWRRTKWMRRVRAATLRNQLTERELMDLTPVEVLLSDGPTIVWHEVGPLSLAEPFHGASVWGDLRKKSNWCPVITPLSILRDVPTEWAGDVRLAGL